MARDRCSLLLSLCCALAACEEPALIFDDAARPDRSSPVATDGATDGSRGEDGSARADAAAPPVDSSATPPADLCAAPAGNVISRGSFELGLSGDAPTGWEARSPAALAGCARSGTPAQHVFLTDPAPGCAGRALAVDARGQWDCYAVQTVSGYNTITPGRRYRVSATVRSERNAPRGSVCPECAAAWFVLGVQWLDAGDRFFGDEKNPRPPSTSEHDFAWRVLSWELVAPPNARRALVWLTAHYPGRVDFDNVSIAPAG